MSTTDNNLVKACETSVVSGSDSNAKRPEAVAIGVGLLDVGRAVRGIATAVAIILYVLDCLYRINRGVYSVLVKPSVC